MTSYFDISGIWSCWCARRRLRAICCRRHCRSVWQETVGNVIFDEPSCGLLLPLSTWSYHFVLPACSTVSKARSGRVNNIPRFWDEKFSCHAESCPQLHSSWMPSAWAEQSKLNAYALHPIHPSAPCFFFFCNPFFSHGALRDRQSLSFAAVVLMEHSRGLFSWTNLGEKNFQHVARKTISFMWPGFWTLADLFRQMRFTSEKPWENQTQVSWYATHSHVHSCTHMVEFFFFRTHHQREWSLPWHDSDQTWQQHLHGETKTISVHTYNQTLLTGVLHRPALCNLQGRALTHSHTLLQSLHNNLYRRWTLHLSHLHPLLNTQSCAVLRNAWLNSWLIHRYFLLWCKKTPPDHG